MRVLWTLVKIALALCLVIPVGIVVLALALGIFGALLGLAIMTLRFAVVALIIWGLYRLAMGLFGGRSQRAAPQIATPARPVDPHYEAAMRELDQELGGSPR